MVTVERSNETTDGNIFATDGIEAVAFAGTPTVPVGRFVVVIVTLPVTTRTITLPAGVQDDGSGGSNTYFILSQGGQDAQNEETTLGGEVWFFGAFVERAMTTVTVTLSAALAAPAKITIFELSGHHLTTPAEDVAIADTTTGLSHAVGPVATAAAGSLLIGAQMTGATETFTDIGGFTAVAQWAEGVVASLEVGPASTTWTVTTSGNAGMAMVLVAIQPAEGVGGGPVVPVDLTLTRPFNMAIGRR